MRQPSEEEIRALEAEMAKLTVDDVLLQTIVTLLNLGARKAGLADDSEPDWPQVKDAIDGARALLPIVEPRHGEAPGARQGRALAAPDGVRAAQRPAGRAAAGGRARGGPPSPRARDPPSHRASSGCRASRERVRLTRTRKLARAP